MLDGPARPLSISLLSAGASKRLERDRWQVWVNRSDWSIEFFFSAAVSIVCFVNSDWLNSRPCTGCQRLKQANLDWLFNYHELFTYYVCLLVVILLFLHHKPQATISLFFIYQNWYGTNWIYMQHETSPWVEHLFERVGFLKCYSVVLKRGISQNDPKWPRMN